MTYQKRTYTDTEEIVTYQDMNRIEQGIYDNSQRIEVVLTHANEHTDTEMAKRVLKTDYETNQLELGNTIAKLKEADVALQEDIDKRVLSEVYATDKAAIEKSIADNVKVLTEKNASQDLDISSKVAKDTYEIDKAAMEKSIAEKTTTSLNGTQTNVNFIENKVVQDGLKYITKNQTNRVDTSVSIVSDIYIQMYLTHNANTSSIHILGIGVTHYLAIDATGKLVLFLDGVANTISNVSNSKHYIEYYKIGSYITVKCDTITKTYPITNTLTGNIAICGFSPTGGTIGTSVLDYMSIYSKPLTSKEIQHNFSVLNNTPSINRINDYAISTDTDHIQDCTGRTIDTINRVFYKDKCKEISSNGGDIVVNNGLEGYLLSATLQGNTKVFKSPKGTNTWTEIPSTETRDTVTYDYKLESTKAIISNNGTKYSFYSSLEDKLANRAIDLGKIGDVTDTFGIKEDGSGICIKNTFGEIFTGNINEAWMLDDVNNSVSTLARFVISVPSAIISAEFDKYIISNYFASQKVTSTSDIESISLHPSIARISIKILKTKLVTPDVAGFKTWLALNPITVRYQLATPMVTHIPKELVPAVLTKATNTFTFSDAVAPSKVTIQAPTTDDIAKSYENIVLLNGYTQTTGTATPVVNLANTGIIRLQMDLTAPSTGMNATIFTLPTELRPVTTQRIPVFVNGVSQLATIDKTTGNVNLASVPSASANVYIKTDYRRDI